MAMWRWYAGADAKGIAAPRSTIAFAALCGTRPSDWPANTAVTHGWSALALSAYLLLAIRIAYRSHQRGLGIGDSCHYGGACVLGKFPEMLGQVKFGVSRMSGRPSAIIEYKPIRTP